MISITTSPLTQLKELTWGILIFNTDKIPYHLALYHHNQTQEINIKGPVTRNLTATIKGIQTRHKPALFIQFTIPTPSESEIDQTFRDYRLNTNNNTCLTPIVQLLILTGLLPEKEYSTIMEVVSTLNKSVYTPEYLQLNQKNSVFTFANYTKPEILEHIKKLKEKAPYVNRN